MPFTLEQLRALDGAKWNRYGPDVLSAWVADMDFRQPQVALDAVVSVAERADLGYNRSALYTIPEAFSRWQVTSHGWQPDEGSVKVFNDVLHAISIALYLHTDPGDGVVLFTPIYPPFIDSLSSSSRRRVDVPLEPGSWRLNPEWLADAIDPGTKAILLCNPHNPTGRVFDQAELRAIASVAEAHDLLIISDEVWADLLHPGSTHRPIALLDDDTAARTITITSASKSFNLAGLRTAVAHVGHQPLLNAINDAGTHFLGEVSTPGAEATIAAWTHGRPWLDQMKAHLDVQRRHLNARLSAEAPAVGYSLPEATYLAWLDFTRTGLGHEPSRVLLKQYGLALSSGLGFGPLGVGFARMNFATSAEILDLLIDRIVAAVTGAHPD